METKGVSVIPPHSLIVRPLARRNVLATALSTSAFFLFGFTGCANDTTDTLITYPANGSIVAWSPDGTRIATMYNKGEVALWSTESEKASKPLLVYQGHQDFIQALAWSPSSQQIATISADHLFTIWDTSKGGAPLFSTSLRQSKSISTSKIVWTPDGTKIAVLLNEQLLIWQVESMDRPVYTLSPSFSGGCMDFYWSPDSQRFVEVGLGSMNIWNIKNLKRPVSTLEDPNKTVLPGPTWSPDWTKIAFIVPFKHIEIWSADRKRLLATLKKDEARDVVKHLVWSPDSTYLAASVPNFDKRASCLVWDVRKGSSEAVVRYNGHKQKRTSGTIYALSWSPDSRQIVTTGDNFKTQVWRVH